MDLEILECQLIDPLRDIGLAAIEGPWHPERHLVRFEVLRQRIANHRGDGPIVASGELLNLTFKRSSERFEQRYEMRRRILRK